ncbi:hypothetical protein Y032_0796g2396, partial [Ancylostoma ceylanicum]
MADELIKNSHKFGDQYRISNHSFPPILKQKFADVIVMTIPFEQLRYSRSDRSTLLAYQNRELENNSVSRSGRPSEGNANASTLVTLMSGVDLLTINAVICAAVCLVQISLAVAGIFGHSCILYATCKTKEIQTKYGMLLVQLSITHIVCIFGELLNAAFLVSAPVLDESTCFKIFAVLSASMLWQSIIMLAISIDLLCAIVVPLLYRDCTTRACVTANVLLCGVLSAAYTFIIYSATRSEKYGECSVYSVQHDTVALFVGIVNCVIAFSQVLIYITCFTIMYIR